MIPFPFNENRFSFFVAGHPFVGQLCTNPQSDWTLLSCLKVTQCSTSEIGDAPLYNSCSLPIQVMTTGPLPTPSKCPVSENSELFKKFDLGVQFQWEEISSAVQQDCSLRGSEAEPTTSSRYNSFRGRER